MVGAVEPKRHIHLILENDHNQTCYLKHTKRDRCPSPRYTAQWNDDVHHALHVLITGETDGYYVDYSERPLDQLGRCLTDGFAYQGEASRLRNGQNRGQSTNDVPSTAFISFLQNHDQVGNRPFGERITKLADPRAVRAGAAILLLAPSPPMMFMGEEFGAETPFLFFCDFQNELAVAVSEGLRNEFAHFSRFSDSEQRERIPDPSNAATFEASRLNWNDIEQPRHRGWLGFYRRLLKLRSEHIAPRLSSRKIEAAYEILGESALRAQWKFPDRSELTLLANLGTTAQSGISSGAAPIIYASDEISVDVLRRGTLPAWSVAWLLES
jgi:maltooligosyltrehalose trehalohydrolase